MIERRFRLLPLMMVLGLLLLAHPEVSTSQTRRNNAATERQIEIASRPEVIPHASIEQPQQFHPLFKPREAFAAQSPLKHAVTVQEAPLTRAWPKEAEEENPEVLLKRWEKRTPPANYQKIVEQALEIPDGPASAVESRATEAGNVTGWSQIGLGIQDRDSRHHKAGRIRAAAYAYDHEQGAVTLWLGASSGGLWRFVTAGFLGLWVPVSDNLPGSPSVGAFLVHPHDSSRILIGTGDWYRYGGDGLYRTVDRGATWTRASMTPTPGAFFKIIADHSDTSANTVLACSDLGIWRSTDFGTTWNRVYTGVVTDLVQDPVYPRSWYAGTPGIGVLASNDAGMSFHARGTGIRGSVGRVSLTLCNAAPNYVYALIEGMVRDAEGREQWGQLNNVYRSQDYGATWMPIDTVDMISWGQANHACAIGVDPNDPNRLFVGMGGVQWTQNATERTPCWTRNVGDGCHGCSALCVDGGHADFTAFLFQPGTKNVIITNDGGYYLYNYETNTINGAGNLVLNVAQIGSLAASLTTPDLLLSGLQDNGMVRITGESLRFLDGGDGGSASISPDNPDHFFFSSGAAFYRYFSLDRGATWTNINCSLGNQWASKVLIDQTPRLTVPFIYTHTDRYAWYKPVSSSCDWREVNGGHPLPESFSINNVERANDRTASVLYLTGWKSGALYVMDSTLHGSVGGMGWAERTPPLPAGSTRNEALVTADRSSLQPGTVYYTTSSARPSRAYLSTNRGVTWRDVTGDLVTKLPNANYYELIANPRNLNQLFLATHVGIFRSDNGGGNWYRYMEGLPRVVDVNSIELRYDDRASDPTLYISTYGRGYWKRTVTSNRAVTVSAASFSVNAIATKAIVAAFGSDLATSIAGASSQPLPTQLGGTTVTVRDSLGVERLAPVFFVSPGQVNYQIPAGTATGAATVIITNGDGIGATGTIDVRPAAPSIFTTNAAGTGAAAAVDAFTGAAGPFNATRADGQPNIIAVFGTGLGNDATDLDGNVSASVEVRIDGRPVTVQYAGRAPGFTGLNQFNIALPAGISGGTHTLTITRGATSNSVTLTIR